MRGLNEHAIIKEIIRHLGHPAPPVSRIGNDVASIPCGEGMLIAKSDMLVAKTDVPVQMTLEQAARKSIVMCVSDFVAKGVRPRYALISLGIPKGWERRQVLELARGFKRAKEEFSLEIVGGDTNECDDLVIDCTMLGFAGKTVPRSGAVSGDVVFVTGLFGNQSAGLRILTKGASAEPSFRERAVLSVLEPQARLSLGVALAEAGLVNAAMDSSDGLAICLHEIAEQSNVHVEVDRVPDARGVRVFAEEHGVPLEDLVFYGGEEYEIVGSASASLFPEACRVARGLGCSLTAIGRVVKGKPGVTLKVDRRKTSIRKKGWIHLA